MRRFTLILFGIFATIILGLAPLTHAAIGKSPPLPPRNIQIQEKDNVVLITWEKPSTQNFSSFRIYRSRKSGKLGNLIKRINKNTLYFLDSDIQKDITYFYTVRTARYGRLSKNKQQISLKILSNKTTFSKLSISGNLIVNEEGQEIRLRGVHFTDPFVLENDDLNQDGEPDNHFADIATDFVRVKALGANVVRVAIYPGFYQLVGGESYLSRYVDRLIDLAEKNKLYIILSYQVIGRPGSWYFSGADTMLAAYPAKVHYTDSDMAVAFWNTVAARYGQREHVLFEIYNEPADDTVDFTWADWRLTGQLLIDTVRKHSDNIILGSATEYSSDLSAVLGNPYSDSNLIYVAHIYPITAPEGEDQVPEWERRFGFLAKTYPVIVSEWGFHDGTTDEVVNGTIEGYARPLINYLDQKNIHWVAFVYHPPDAEPPMLESDWTTLNEFGKFVKERLTQ